MQLKICFALLVQSGRGMGVKLLGFPVRVREGAPDTGYSLEDRQESSKLLYVGSNPTTSTTYARLLEWQQLRLQTECQVFDSPTVLQVVDIFCYK